MDDNDRRIVNDVWANYRRRSPLERLRIADEYAKAKAPAEPVGPPITAELLAKHPNASVLQLAPGDPRGGTIGEAYSTACYLEKTDMTVIRRDMQWQAIKERCSLIKEHLKSLFWGLGRLIKLQVAVWRGE